MRNKQDDAGEAGAVVVLSAVVFVAVLVAGLVAGRIEAAVHGPHNPDAGVPAGARPPTRYQVPGWGAAPAARCPDRPTCFTYPKLTTVDFLK